MCTGLPKVLDSSLEGPDTSEDDSSSSSDESLGGDSGESAVESVGGLKLTISKAILQQAASQGSPWGSSKRGMYYMWYYTSSWVSYTG